MQVPYFYTGPNVARINVAMDIPGDSLSFNKEKGKYHSNVNVLGIAYKPDGSVGARFSDTLDLNLEKDEWKDLTKRTRITTRTSSMLRPEPTSLLWYSAQVGSTSESSKRRLAIPAYDGKKLTLGGIVLSTNMQRVDQISSSVDATLLEDRTPLIVKGMQITPAAKYQFKKSGQRYCPLLRTPCSAANYR